MEDVDLDLEKRFVPVVSVVHINVIVGENVVRKVIIVTITRWDAMVENMMGLKSPHRLQLRTCRQTEGVVLNLTTRYAQINDVVPGLPGVVAHRGLRVLGVVTVVISDVTMEDMTELDSL